MSQNYAQYINGPAWRTKRLERARYDNFKCSRCGDAERLEVHHVTYERLGNERIDDIERERLEDQQAEILAHAMGFGGDR